MEYKRLFALVKGMLLAALKGERMDIASLNEAVLRLEVAIDNAVVKGTPASELENMRCELLTIRKAVWYADRGE